MTSANANRKLVLLFGTSLVFATGDCGRSGMLMPGSGGDAGRGTTDSSNPSSRGGVMVSSTFSSAGGATSSGADRGGVTASTGSNGRGGASSSGGNQGSGGSAGGRTGSVPRVPTRHRPQANSCVGVFAPAEPVDPSSYSECKKHADCAQRKNGHCILDPVGIGRASRMYYCSYDGCATDATCGAGLVCYCTPSDPPRCFLSGNCRIDADCGGGATSYCSPSYGEDCGGYHAYGGYYCHTPRDTCFEDSDCTGSDYCDYDLVDGRWECKSLDLNCRIG